MDDQMNRPGWFARRPVAGWILYLQVPALVSSIQ